MPAKWSILACFIVLVALIATAAFVAPEYEGDTYYSRGMCLAGLALTIGLLWATSRHRRMVCWYTVLVGLYLQFMMAMFVLRTDVGYNIFSWLSDRAADLLGFADDGLAFLTDSTVPTLSWFLITVAPPIIFFAALAQLLAYWYVEITSHNGPSRNFLLLTNSSFSFSQGRFTVVSQEMRRVFLLGPQGLRRRGRGGSDLALFWSRRECNAYQAFPLRPHQVGDASNYVLRLCDDCRQCARRLSETRREWYSTYIFLYVLHITSQSWLLISFPPAYIFPTGVMSIPASIVVSKLRYPEEEETTSSEKLSLASVEDARQGAGNWMHAFTNGAWLGVRLAGIVVAVLACVIAGVGLVDAILTWAGSYLNIENLTLEVIFGYLFVPVAFFLGIPNRELVLVGRLIAIKFLKVSHRERSMLCSKRTK